MISHYQIEREQERMETKAYRRKHLEQFIRDHKRLYFKEKYSRELVNTLRGMDLRAR
jgi:hypothetical protein